MREFLIALSTTIILTPLVRWGAVRVGWIHRPDPRKWVPQANPHPRLIAMGGGLAIFIGVLIAAIGGHSHLPLSVLVSAGAALLLGLWDDLKGCCPAAKLTFQTLLGVSTVLVVGWVHGLPAWLAIPVTIFGIVGVMNSVNMMDNMDGTASGLMTLMMLGYATLGMVTQNRAVSALSLAMVGACLGFWVYNKPPAIVFMGDAGSMMLGYLLAVVGIWATHGEYPHRFAQLFSPFLLVGLFVTDTIFVVMWRRKKGLPVMRGDKNHLSHRLAVQFGRSEWKANGVLYVIQIGLNLLALSVAVTPIPLSMSSVAVGFAIPFLLVWKLWGIVPSKSPALSR